MEGGKWVPFGSTNPTHTVTEANEGLGWDPLLKHVMILVVTGNLGWGVRSIMFHLGSLVELPDHRTSP